MSERNYHDDFNRIARALEENNRIGAEILKGWEVQIAEIAARKELRELDLQNLRIVAELNAIRLGEEKRFQERVKADEAKVSR